MFLEDPQIDLPYSCHAMTRSWLVHGFADQGARLYVGDTLASPSTLFHIDHHADHTHPESEARVGNLAHCAFSSAISGNVRIFGGNPLIWNYQYISAALWHTDTTPWEGMTMHLALNLNVQVKDGTLVLTDGVGKTVTFSEAQSVQKKVSMITLGELCSLPKRQLATGFG